MFGLSKPNPKDKGAKLDQARAQAQNQAPDSIPGMFKPGEFVLPPDTVHAMGGKQALQGVVNATHTPVTPEGTPAAGLGLKVPAPQPEVFFANGGAPEDELAKRAPVSPSNTFPQASPSAGANIYAGAGVSRDQFGSSGKMAQVPAGIGGNPAAPAGPAIQPPAPKPNSFGDAAAATNNAGVTQLSTPATAGFGLKSTQGSAPAAAPALPPSAAPSPSNIYPGNRLQGDSGFSGAPKALPQPAPMADGAATAKLKSIADMNSRGESYGSNAPTMASFGLNPATQSAPATQAAPAVRNPGASELYMQDRAQEMGDQWRAGNYAQAAGTAGRTAVQGLGMYGLELADKTLTPVGNAIGGFAKGLFGMGDAQAATAEAQPAAPAAKPSATAPATAATTASPSAPAAQTAKSAATAPATTSIAQAAPANTAVASTLPTGVYNHGRGQYSDQASGMGFPAGFTGRPNAQNMAAADALSQRSQQESGARVAAAQPQEAGMGFSSPFVAHSGNDWAARQRLKDMETSASSITNRAEWRSGSSTPAGGSRHQQGVNDPDGKIARYNAAVQADLAAQGKVPDMQLKTNEVNAGLQRTAMAEAGADRRAQGQIGLGLGQLSLGAQRNQLDAQRINSDERLRAPQIRAAERLGQLQDAYINAKTPEEQAAISNQIRAYAGKNEDSWKAVALQGGTDAQGNKTESMLGAVNERTGEMKRMGGQQQAPQYVKGGVYQDPQGRKQRWNGTAFEPL